MKDLSSLKYEYSRNKEIKSIIDNEDDIDFVYIYENFNISSNSLKYLIKNYDLIQDKILKRITYIETICNEFKKGRTLECISNEYNTTRQNINRIISLGNVDRADGGISKIILNRVDKIKEFINEGKSLEFIIENLSLSEYTIRNYCSENNIEILTENQIKFNNKKKEIIKLRDEGKSQLEISNLLNVSQSYVSKVLLNENKRTYLSDDDFLMRDSTIFKEFSNGKDLLYLSNKYNMSVSNVRRILNKFS